MLLERNFACEPIARLAAVLVATLTTATLPAQPLQWVKKPFQTASYGASSAYDSTRHRAVVFGGVAGNETWEWDGQRWTLHEPGAWPTTPSFAMPMAYDPIRERTVLYQTSLKETWEWDGHAWVERSPTNSPGLSASAAPMAFDGVSQRILLFNPATAITWAWDGVDWTTVSRSGPSARPSVMAFDPIRQRTTLLNAGETWDWNGAMWIQREANGPHFTQYDTTNVAFDRGRGVIVLTLHRQFLAGPHSTWEWDGNTWSYRGSAVRLLGRAMWYDEVRGRVVAFGGVCPDPFSPTVDEMDEWDGSQWTRIRPELVPSSSHGMAYDSARQRVVMVGTNGTVEWDGASWTRLRPATAPSADRGLGLAYDAGRRTTVLFGGRGASTLLDETWEWDGASWTRRFPAHSPPPLAEHSMAYDAARGRVVLFGGGQTWEWDGFDWTQLAPANKPPPRDGAAMAYHAARQRIVLFGGGIGFGPADTWEWDGVDWTERTPASSPSPRASCAMAYDSDRQRTVLFGGAAAFAPHRDTWEWDGSQWTRLSLSVSPSPRAAAMAYHAVTKRMVLFGGEASVRYGPTDSRNDTWVFGQAQKATSVAYGNACPGTRGAPRLGALGRPTFGNEPLQLEVLQVLPGAPSVLLLSAGAASTPLGGGCELAVAASPTVAIGSTATAAGWVRFGVQIPVVETLNGLSVYSQAVVIDPQGAWLQLAFSRGLQLIIGD